MADEARKARLEQSKVMNRRAEEAYRRAEREDTKEAWEAYQRAEKASIQADREV